MPDCDYRPFPFAQRGEIGNGTSVLVDEGFDCMPSGRQIVEKDEDGHFIRCANDRHRLVPNEDGVYPGIFL